MTAAQIEAKRLYGIFWKLAPLVVDEIVKECKQVNSRVDFDKYWQEVKTELKKY